MIKWTFLIFTMFVSFTSSAQRIENRDLVRLKKLKPTVYKIADEASFSCVGWYGRRGVNRKYYNGSERTKVINPDGQVLATLCTRYYRDLLMQGTGLVVENEEELTLNYAGKIGGKHRFVVIRDRCIYGFGARPDLCLLPFHTIAADLKKHKIGKIIYIPRAKGLRLPDGSRHNGLFVVRDTGGAFENVGVQRVDLFGYNKNSIFLNAGFDKRRPEKAFYLKGRSKERAERWFASRFGEQW